MTMHPFENALSRLLDRRKGAGPSSIPSGTVTDDANIGIRFADPISTFPATDASVPGRVSRVTNDILRVGVSQNSPSVRLGGGSSLSGQGNYAGSDIDAARGISVGEPLTRFENPGIFGTGKGMAGKAVGRAGELVNSLRTRLGFPR